MILIALSLFQHTKPIRSAGARCPRRPDLGGDQATERAAQMTDKPRTQPNKSAAPQTPNRAEPARLVARTAEGARRTQGGAGERPRGRHAQGSAQTPRTRRY